MTDTEIVDFIAKYLMTIYQDSIYKDREEYNIRFLDDNGDIFSIADKEFRRCIEIANKRIANTGQGELGNEELF